MLCQQSNLHLKLAELTVSLLGLMPVLLGVLDTDAVLQLYEASFPMKNTMQFLIV